MPNINSLTYNGMKSTDLGVYVTGSGSFDAAEMDADKYEIAGRNGDLIIPKNRYKNIVVTYPAFIPKAFQGKAQSIRNWMRSAKTYARLEDTYDMEHYRLGLASGIQSFEPVNRNDASNFQLSFDCKPQRFLKTGETPLPIEPEAHSYSGEIVEFETVAVDDMKKAEVSLSPIQSLNGYDHPWAGGAGKNLFDESLLAQGSVDNPDSSYNVHYDGYIPVEPSTTYMWSQIAPVAGRYISQYDSTKTLIQGGSISQYNTAIATFDTVANAAYILLQWYSVDEITPDQIRALKPQVEIGSVATAWTPYENICPISGHDSATLNIGAEYPTADETYPVTFPQTVYGGTFDFVSGKLVVEWANETLTSVLDVVTLGGHPCARFIVSDIKASELRGDFICSHFAKIPGYVGNHPGNGQVANQYFNYANVVMRNDSLTTAEEWNTWLQAQNTAGTPVTFCHALATPIEIDLDPTEVQTLFGLNNVWASDGTVEVNYADPFNVDNPTYFEARPLFEITNPAQNDVLNVNGKTITFLSSYTGTVTIDCETMNCYSGYANMNYLISATDFPVLNEGLNIVTWSGSGSCTMTPRWWEL